MDAIYAEGELPDKGADLQRLMQTTTEIRVARDIRAVLIIGAIGDSSRRKGGSACGVTFESMQIQDRHVTIVQRD